MCVNVSVNKNKGLSKGWGEGPGVTVPPWCSQIDSIGLGGRMVQKKWVHKKKPMVLPFFQFFYSHLSPCLVACFFFLLLVFGSHSLSPVANSAMASILLMQSVMASSSGEMMGALLFWPDFIFFLGGTAGFLVHNMLTLQMSALPIRAD